MYYSRKQSNVINYDRDIELTFIVGVGIIIFMMILMYIILR